MEYNHLCIFCYEHNKEHLCKIILKSDQLFRRRCRLKVFLFSLWWPFCSGEQTQLCNFGREPNGKPSCELWRVVQEISFKEQVYRQRKTQDMRRPTTINHLQYKYTSILVQAQSCNLIFIASANRECSDKHRLVKACTASKIEELNWKKGSN